MNKQDKKIMNLIKYKKMLGGRKMNLEKAIKEVKELRKVIFDCLWNEEYIDSKVQAIDTILTALDERYNKGYEEGYIQGYLAGAMERI